LLQPFLRWGIRPYAIGHDCCLYQFRQKGVMVGCKAGYRSGDRLLAYLQEEARILVRMKIYAL
jgi:hypothetical protein